MQETQREKIEKAVREEIEITDYDPSWPGLFEQEKEHLQACLPSDLTGRIEHFGSTAVPGLAAKPIIDMLVEVTDLTETRRRIAPILEAQGYDYFWRPLFGDDTPPFYAWFIKRDSAGNRTHHIHMVENDFEHWDRLLFRDYLRDHPDMAKEYGRLKIKLSKAHPHDRVAYTQAKTDFITRVTAIAKGSGTSAEFILAAKPGLT
ncbi:MAG: GrpB family protein [Pseudomonadota bacterium]